MQRFIKDKLHSEGFVKEDGRESNGNSRRVKSEWEDLIIELSQGKPSQIIEARWSLTLLDAFRIIRYRQIEELKVIRRDLDKKIFFASLNGVEADELIKTHKQISTMIEEKNPNFMDEEKESQEDRFMNFFDSIGMKVVEVKKQ